MSLSCHTPVLEHHWQAVIGETERVKAKWTCKVGISLLLGAHIFVASLHFGTFGVD